MPGKRIRILVNSAARTRRHLTAVRAQACDGASLEWIDCTSAADLQEQVRKAQQEPLDVLGLAGGDGTLALALNALEALNRVPLGILPAGSGNDFARHLGIPQALPDALQLLSMGQPQRVDVGRANWPGRPDSRRFCCAASVGLGELALRLVQRSWLPRCRALYLSAALRAVWSYRPRKLRVSWRDGTYEGEVVFVAVTNTRHYGGGFPVSPSARLNDGLLDLCLVQGAGRLRLLTQFPRLLQGTHGELPEVILAQTPWVRLEGVGEELPVALDGELPGRTTPVELHCEPAALQMLLPQVQAETAAPELVPQALPAFQAGLSESIATDGTRI
jgi:diacylglycerol kinase (ATP)